MACTASPTPRTSSSSSAATRLPTSRAGTVGGGRYPYTYYAGCVAYSNDSRSAQDGACAGVGCCHVDIPPGFTDNVVSFTPDGAWVHAKQEFCPCDYAFIVDRYNYTFRTADLHMDVNRTSMPLWLDWAIRDNNSGSAVPMSCAAAAKNPGYACVSADSECVDSSNGPGYSCNCTEGYEGNPYVVNGCTNIDECARPAEYPCHGVCKDTQGSYDCKCRPGYQSNDAKTERCTPKFPLAAQLTVGAIGGLFVIALLVLLIILRKEKRKMREFFIKNGGPTLEKAKMIKIYKREDLKLILKSSNLIGKGGFGEVYKGLLDNQLVAVKKPSDGNVTHNKQFANEVIIQSQVIHKNIVRLIGCCLEVDIPMLVYEFLPKGSLDEILHGSSRVPLDLHRRLNIAAESAEGLAYMHSKTTSKILHGDVKPANILLDDSFVPKISDFGISRLIAIDKQHTNYVIGDRSYMDPAYLQTGLLTDKSDVYSFGVVLLELISRKKATHSDNSSLVKNFLDAHKMQKRATELFDDEIAAPKDLELLDSLVAIAVECLNLDVEQRPEMTDVAERLLMLKRSWYKQSRKPCDSESTGAVV